MALAATEKANVWTSVRVRYLMVGHACKRSLCALFCAQIAVLLPGSSFAVAGAEEVLTSQMLTEHCEKALQLKP